MTTTVDGANYTPITDAELLIYRRGARTEVVDRKRFLRKAAPLEITVDDDVVVHSRIKPAEWFAEKDIDPGKREIGPGVASLKQFRNVPRADIEMLLPATQVRFRTVDTLKIAVPAAVSAALVLATKLLPTLLLLFVLAGSYVGLRDEEPEINQAALLILFGGTVALGSFVIRQWRRQMPTVGGVLSGSTRH